MTRSERVKESQLAIARGMKVPDEELKILDTVPDWAAREWLYVCALDHIPLNRVIEECGGNVTASKVKEKRGKYLNEIYKPSLFEAGDVKEELAKLQKDREKCDAERFANVDQFMAGTLDKEVYQSRRADLTRKADRLDAEIAELEAKYHEAEVIQDDGVQNALEMLDMFSDITELDQDIVGALIEKVLVYDPRHVEIRWKFSDEVMKLLQG